MKLVIDIQDDIYNLIKNWNNPTDTAHKMLFEWVTNGMPLEKVLGEIKAEINDNMESIIGVYDSSTPENQRPLCKGARNDARKECIAIIDKYISGKEKE